jgi:hypothetical protein
MVSVWQRLRGWLADEIAWQHAQLAGRTHPLAPLLAWTVRLIALLVALCLFVAGLALLAGALATFITQTP